MYVPLPATLVDGFGEIFSLIPSKLFCIAIDRIATAVRCGSNSNELRHTQPKAGWYYRHKMISTYYNNPPIVTHSI